MKPGCPKVEFVVDFLREGDIRHMLRIAQSRRDELSNTVHIGYPEFKAICEAALMKRGVKKAKWPKEKRADYQREYMRKKKGKRGKPGLSVLKVFTEGE